MLRRIFYGKKYKCVWCGKTYTVDYEPTIKKDSVPLCSVGCFQSYKSYSKK